jgi:hypothetical protein
LSGRIGFGLAKQHLGGYQFHSKEEVEMAIREWLKMWKLHFYHDRNFKLMPVLDMCMGVLWVVLKNIVEFL